MPNMTFHAHTHTPEGAASSPHRSPLASALSSPHHPGQQGCQRPHRQLRAALCPHVALPTPGPGSSSLNEEITFIKAKAELATENKAEGCEGVAEILLPQGSYAYPQPPATQSHPGGARVLRDTPSSPSPQRPGRGCPAPGGRGPTPRLAAPVQRRGLLAPDGTASV